MRPRVYVSGPITGTAGDGATTEQMTAHARDAVEIGQQLLEMGFAPFVPHLTVWWEILRGKKNEWETWLQLDEPWVLVSDLLVRMPGISKGADREVALAEANGIPVYDWTDRTCKLQLAAYLAARNVRALTQDTTTHAAPIRESVLGEADRLVEGDRQHDYGHPAEDFARTALVWSAVLGVKVEAWQVPLCMVGVKISREVNRPKRDNLVDMAGYVKTLEMVRQREASA